MRLFCPKWEYDMMNRIAKKPAFLAFAIAFAVAECCAGQIVLTADNAEVVISPGAPDITLFAAEEMTNFLSRAFGADVPLVTSPTRGKASVIVGTNQWSAGAGVNPRLLKRDGFVLKTDVAAKRIYVAGCDDSGYSLRSKMTRPPDAWGQDAHERASVFATYGFLERFAGVRFYFPGEIGTIVPRTDAIYVPETEIADEPDWRCRIVFTYEFGEWPDKVDSKTRNRLMRLEQLRLRSQTESFNSCHGQYRMNMAKRFGKTHPEYFTMKADGTRYNNPSGRAKLSSSQHLCQSSKVWDEIYEDAKSYFSGEGPERRGVLSGFDEAARVGWGRYCFYRKYYDVMPHDGHPKCACPDCKAAYAKAPNPRSAASELVWGQTARLARRIKEDGLPGVILQAAYADYRAVPKVDIPDNVIVNLCLSGPWSASEGDSALQRDYDMVRAWGDKAGGRLWLWVYVGKFSCSNLNIPDVPMGAPRAMARYLKAVAPHVLGVFPELGSERFIYHYLDLYLYSRIAWDNSCDVDAVLSEHYRLMYGAGGAAMEELFDAIESNWLFKIIGKKSATPWGYSYSPPDEYDLFTKVFSPSEIARLEAIAAKALGAVPAGSAEAKRIGYVCEKTLGPLVRHAREYPATIDPAEELKWRRDHAGESLLRNGSFDSHKGWSRASGTTSVDTNVYFSAPSSLRISSTDDSPMKGGAYSRASALQSVKLKPSTRYRLSGFLRLENVVAVCPAGGADFLVAGPVGSGFPLGKNPTGTRDWHRFAYEFKTPDKFDGDSTTAIGPRIVLGHGTIWVDDLRLDELTNETKEK